MDIKPILIGAILLVVILLFWLNWREDSYDVIEEPNPDYLQEIGKGRQLLINEILEHLRLAFALTDDEIKNCSCELVREHTNRLTIASQDQIITILCVWGRKVVLSCYRNKNVDGVKLIYMKKSFKLKDNMINWKKFDRFAYKAVDKFMAVEENEEDFKTLITSAAEVANEVNEDEAAEILFRVADNYPWTGKKLPKRFATRDYVGLIAYLLKFHQKEFLEYLKSKEDPEE
jgi:hypothetical protein